MKRSINISYLVLIFTLLIVNSCSDQTEQKILTLKNKISLAEQTILKLQKENTQLKESPEYRYQKAIDHMNLGTKNGYQKAKTILEKVLSQTRSKDLILQVNAKIKQCQTLIYEYDSRETFQNILKSKKPIHIKLKSLNSLQEGKTLSFNNEIREAVQSLKKQYEDSAQSELNGILDKLKSDKKSDIENTLQQLNVYVEDYKDSKLLAKAQKKIKDVQSRLKNFEAHKVASYKKDCKRYKYEVLKRDANSLIGKKIFLRGQVFNVNKSGSLQFIQINSTKRYIWTNQVIVLYSGKTQVYDKNIIQVYGEIQGFHSYTSQANYKITVPKIVAKYIIK